MDFDSLRTASTRRRWKALAAGIDIEILLRDAQSKERASPWGYKPMDLLPVAIAVSRGRESRLKALKDVGVIGRAD